MTVSLFVLIGAALERDGIVSRGFFSESWLGFLQNFGFAGRALDFMVNVVLFIDSLFIIALVLVLIPFLFIVRDMRKTLRRYGFQGHKSLKLNKENLYLQVAAQIFQRSPDTTLFIYGHTHQPSLTKINGGYVINTGSWLKKLQRIPARFRFLPAVYSSSFQLNYFKVFEENSIVEIIYECIPKAVQSNLTPLEKTAIFGRKTTIPIRIPQRTKLVK